MYNDSGFFFFFLVSQAVEGILNVTMTSFVINIVYVHLVPNLDVLHMDTTNNLVLSLQNHIEGSHDKSS